MDGATQLARSVRLAVHARSGHDPLTLVTEHLRIVIDGRADDCRSIGITIASHHGDLRRLARNELVGGKVVLQTLEQCARQIAQLARSTPDIVSFEDGNDFVVRLTAIDDLQSTNDDGAQYHFLVIDWTLADHADVQRIAIASVAAGRETTNTIAAIGLRNESIERGRMGRSALRPIDAQIAGGFVDFIFHQVVGRDLDEGVDDSWRFGTRLETVPGMWTPTGIGTGGRFGHSEFMEVAKTGEAAFYKRTDPVILRSSTYAGYPGPRGR